MKTVAFSLAITAYAVACVAMAESVSRNFGTGLAVFYSILVAIPLFVALKLFRRFPRVKPREFLWLLILTVFTSAGGIFVIQNGYANGLHRMHDEDVRYQELERLAREDSAFRDVEFHVTDRKNIHYLTGRVPTEADLNRLYSLAERCGITGRHLDGPHSHSVSLHVVEVRPGDW